MNMKITTEKSTRLHYLDWLRVLATLGVFSLHTMLPFDELDWFVNNAKQSQLVTAARLILLQWGMPLFFLLAGSASYFALRRRTGRQFLSERIMRLVIPLLVGAILIQPFQIYLAILHEGRTDWYEGPFLKLDYFRFYFDSRLGPDLGQLLNPKVFVNYASHLWFLGFLFVFSLILLPLFLWLKRDTGKRLISWLAGMCERRGFILVGIVPLALIRVFLQPLFPDYGAWSDFFFMLAFFVSGYIIFSNERFARTIQRDGKLIFAVAILATLITLWALFAGFGATWLSSPGTGGFMFAWTVLSAVAWCWVIFMLYVGMLYLDFRNRQLEYGQEAIMPFYIIHHPAILVISFYVVQWDAGILVKWLVIALSSIAITLGLTDLIRRIKPIRALFGMKPRRRKKVFNQSITPITQ
jgi:hypothetical protein